MFINRNLPSVGFNQGNNRNRVTIPSFEHGAPGRILTKTAPKMSEGEFREAIKELARNDAKAGRFHTGPDYNKLSDAFVSVASPDRRSVVSSAMQTHRSVFNAIRLKPLPSFGSPRGQATIHFNHVFERSNRLISNLSLTDFGWEFSWTQAEGLRGQEFTSLYNQVWRETHRELQAGRNSTPPPVSSASTSSGTTSTTDIRC